MKNENETDPTGLKQLIEDSIESNIGLVKVNGQVLN